MKRQKGRGQRATNKQIKTMHNAANQKKKKQKNEKKASLGWGHQVGGKREIRNGYVLFFPVPGNRKCPESGSPSEEGAVVGNNKPKGQRRKVGDGRWEVGGCGIGLSLRKWETSANCRRRRLSAHGNGDLIFADIFIQIYFNIFPFLSAMVLLLPHFLLSQLHNQKIWVGS